MLQTRNLGLRGTRELLSAIWLVGAELGLKSGFWVPLGWAACPAVNLLSPPQRPRGSLQSL